MLRVKNETGAPLAHQCMWAEKDGGASPILIPANTQTKTRKNQPDKPKTKGTRSAKAEAQSSPVAENYSALPT